jgi:zinc transport system permease protein
VIISSVAGGFNVDLFSYLFGNILSVSPLEVWLAGGIFARSPCYRDFLPRSFRDHLRRRIRAGLRDQVRAVNKILIVLTRLSSSWDQDSGHDAGFQPDNPAAISALQLMRSFRSVIVLAGLFAAFSVAVGIFSSYVLNYPSGAAIVMVNFILFAVSFIIGRLRR